MSVPPASRLLLAAHNFAVMTRMTPKRTTNLSFVEPIIRLLPLMFCGSIRSPLARDRKYECTGVLLVFLMSELTALRSLG